MADRTRLPRAQARTRFGKIRRPRVARLSQPRNTLHCSIRLPPDRSRRFSPLRRPTLATRATYPTRQFPTTRICQVIYNDMYLIRFRQGANGSLERSLNDLHTARPAPTPCSYATRQRHSARATINTVILMMNSPVFCPDSLRLSALRIYIDARARLGCCVSSNSEADYSPRPRCVGRFLELERRRRSPAERWLHGKSTTEHPPWAIRRCRRYLNLPQIHSRAYRSGRPFLRRIRDKRRIG
jgi:hypothetical protein